MGQEDYIKSENAKEAKRAAEFKARQDRLDYFFAKSNAEGGAGHKQREDEIREEQILLKNQQDKEARDAKAEHDKAEMIARKTKEALMQNEMLKAKKADMEKQREEDKKFGARYRKESEDYIVAEKKKALKIRQDNLKYQEELKAQMKIEKHDTDRGISVIEKDLNKGVFKTIEKDPVIAKKVAQQLRIAVTNPRD